MAYLKRRYPQFSACGLNCGLCPLHYSSTTSQCPGCGGVDFTKVHPNCGVLSCCQRKNLEFCYLCAEYPCKKYDGVTLSDSFISHKNQLIDLEKAKCLGLDNYIRELNAKIIILQELLNSYDDGRRKSLFCLTVNLFDITDLNSLIEQLKSECPVEASIKEKANIAVHIIQSLAQLKGRELKLRKKDCL